MKRCGGILTAVLLLFALTACRTVQAVGADGTASTTSAKATITEAVTTASTTSTTTTVTTVTTTATAATTTATTTTEAVTAIPTEPSTQPPTEPPTAPPTQPPTEPPTAPPTTAVPTTVSTAKPTAPPTAATKAADRTQTVTDTQLARIKAGFLRLVNEERARLGVTPLSEHAYLNSCALLRSQEITACWSHDRPDGTPFYSVIQYEAYPYAHAGENMCMTPHFGGGSYTEEDRWTGSDAQIESAYTQIYAMFRNSDGHYRNFTDGKYSDTGIGISIVWLAEGIPMFYVSHLFGTECS